MDKKMNFDEIMYNKNAFLENYDLKEDFGKYEKLGGSWDELVEIGKEYEGKSQSYLKKIEDNISTIAKFQNVHSYRYRLKKTDSLLKKIVVKSVKKDKLINKSNYLIEITDLLGIRILYIFKEECFPIHLQIMDAFGGQIAESIRIKLRDGDDENYYSKIIKQSGAIVEKNIYRSIHYTLYSNKNNTEEAKIEIQTRTIFEEGWSEINHKLVYKNVADKYEVLKNASDVLNGLVGNCDKIGSMMKTIYDEYINKLSTEGTADISDSVSAKTVGDVFSLFLNS